MPKHFTILLLVLQPILFSCNRTDSQQHSETDSKTGQGIAAQAASAVTKTYSVNPAELTKDFTTWYNYTYYTIKLSQDFVGHDVDTAVIPKPDFLKRLATGRFIAYKTMIVHGVTHYQLYKLSGDKQDISATSKQKALSEMEHFKLEGQAFPAYSFTDINGKAYDATSTKGKIIVVKCWFIGCVACVKEFPELNALVDKFHDRDDILFLSLATDSKQRLTSFLQKKEFKYAVVPEQEDYMTGKLKINAYPTHFLIDRAGKIVKVVNTIDELIPFLEKQAVEAVL